ncbi:T9SS type A sorting domain-containing protein [Halosquirtibacter laminarini]|uniref:T9SS type A sorting domain-containing protein n=1 Tax=Halosquirtibacter laminarini TaxID=3374600 RepID=A0AC61NJJ8_9BACT|nr:T9SS type A sorting domain-containing protein [Prolixibacteraceae bacterium]
MKQNLLLFLTLWCMLCSALTSRAQVPAFSTNPTCLDVDYANDKLTIDVRAVSNVGDDEVLDYLALYCDGKQILKLRHFGDMEYYETNPLFKYNRVTYIDAYGGGKLGYNEQRGFFLLQKGDQWASSKLDWESVGFTSRNVEGKSGDGKSNDEINIKISLPKSFIPKEWRGKKKSFSVSWRWLEYDSNGINEYIYTPSKGGANKETKNISFPSFEHPYPAVQSEEDIVDNFIEKESISEDGKNLLFDILVLNKNIENSNTNDVVLQNTKVVVDEHELFKLSKTKTYTKGLTFKNNISSNAKEVYVNTKIGFLEDSCTFKLSSGNSEVKIVKVEKQVVDPYLDRLRVTVSVPISSLDNNIRGKESTIKAISKIQRYDTKWYDNELLYKDVDVENTNYYIPHNVDLFKDLTYSLNKDKGEIVINLFEKDSLNSSMYAQYADMTISLGLNNKMKEFKINTSQKNDTIKIRRIIENHRTRLSATIAYIDTTWWGKDIDLHIKGNFQYKVKENSAGSFQVDHMIHGFHIAPLKLYVHNIQAYRNCATGNNDIFIGWGNVEANNGAINVDITQIDKDDKPIEEEVTNISDANYTKSTILKGVSFNSDNEAYFKIDFKLKQNATSPPYIVSFKKTVKMVFDPKIWGVDKYFEASKGSSRENVRLSWRYDKSSIKNFQIVRINPTNNNEKKTFDLIDSNARSFVDNTAQPGTFYKYLIFGLSACNDMTDTLSSIGYRSVKGYISGTLSYDSGAPVENVSVLVTQESKLISYGLKRVASSNVGENPSVNTEELSEEENGSLFSTNFNASNFTLSPEDNTENINEEKGINSFSVGMWYKVSSYSNNTIHFFGFSTENSENIFSLNYKDGFKCIIGSQKNSVDIISNSSLSLVTGEYKQLFFVYDASIKTSSIYQDGVKVASLEKELTIPSYYRSIHASFADNIEGVDEVSVWKKAISEDWIHQNYNRYLIGNEESLIAYYPFSEGVASINGEITLEQAYDYSYHNSVYNSQHGVLGNEAAFSGHGPSPTVLNYKGVSDKYGNYSIVFPFTNQSERITLTPSFGNHIFTPSQKNVFISSSNIVANGQDFIDKSSFQFKGRILYGQSQKMNIENMFIGSINNVDKDITKQSENLYNSYLWGEHVYSKGEYLYDASQRQLKEYTYKVPVKGVNIYVDSKMAVDKNGNPIKSDEKGCFNITVPAGEHYITVGKSKHHFIHQGRFPAATEDNPYKRYDFQSDFINPITFIDTTTVTVIGRVVGGTTEGNKRLGFGQDRYAVDDKKKSELKRVHETSINNIGEAIVKFTLLNDGDINKKFTQWIQTNSTTGEYSLSMFPENYVEDAVYMKSMVDEELQNSTYPDGYTPFEGTSFNKMLNLTSSLVPTIDVDTLFEVNGNVYRIDSVVYNASRNFVYQSTPQLDVFPTNGDIWGLNRVSYSKLATEAGESDIEKDTLTTNFKYPVYRYKDNSSFSVRVFDKYYLPNESPKEQKESINPYRQGKLVVHNTIAESRKDETKNVTKDVTTFSFVVGAPNFKSPYTRTIGIKFLMNDVELNSWGYDTSKSIIEEPEGKVVWKGIVLGAKSTEGSSVLTAGPEIPTMILRDPPGSNSYATLEKGTTFTSETSFSAGYSSETSSTLTISLGPDAKIPFLGTEIDITDDIEMGLTTALSINSSGSFSSSYTLNKTWTTNDDPAYVGAQGDLYIGESYNLLLGKSTALQFIDSATEGEDPKLELKSRASFNVNKSGTTNFIYSQFYLLESLIPTYHKYANGTLELPKDDTPSEKYNVVEKRDAAWYGEQATLWEDIIKRNEEDKYLASKGDLYKRTKNSIKDQIAAIKKDLQKLNDDKKDESKDCKEIDEEIRKLENKKRNLEDRMDRLRKGSKDNISFDAGVGSYEAAKTVSTMTNASIETSISLSASASTTLGLKVGGVGSNLKINTTNSLSASYSDSNGHEETRTISYVLKDSDQGDNFSVDVHDSADGNGPIFILNGGTSKCPYEQAYKTHFFKKDGEFVTIGKGTWARESVKLSYDPKDDKNQTLSLNDIPTNMVKSIPIYMINDNPAGAEGDYCIEIEQGSNPHGLIVKMDGSKIGRTFSMDANEWLMKTITVERGEGEIFDYDDVKIVLHSICQYGNTNQEDIASVISLSVHFQEACSDVSMVAPANNWIVNSHNKDGLQIKLGDFDATLSKFQKFVLQYRQGLNGEWMNIHTFFKNQELLEGAKLSNGMGSVIPEGASTLEYTWPIQNSERAEGNYQLRTLSYCENNISNSSEVLDGVKKMKVPVVFGTPQPSDGILSIGESMMVSYTDDVVNGSLHATMYGMLNNTMSTAEQFHAVSLQFNGPEVMSISNPHLKDGFAMEFWIKTNQDVDGGTIILQGNQDSFDQKVSLNSDNCVEWKLRDPSKKGDDAFVVITAKEPCSKSSFKRYALVYDNKLREMRLYVDGKLDVRQESINIQYDSDRNIALGEGLKAQLHHLRLWSEPIDEVSLVETNYKTLNSSTNHLYAAYPMDEASGVVAHDIVNNNHASVTDNWSLAQQGYSWKFDGSHALSMDLTEDILTTKDNFTLEFWFKGEAQSATLFNLINERTGDRRSDWEIQSKIDGTLHFFYNDKDYPISTTPLLNNQWHHLAMTLDRANQLKFIIDGEVRYSNSEVSDMGIFFGPTASWGGKRSMNDDFTYQTNHFFTGNMDEIRLWRGARNVEQIRAFSFLRMNMKTPGLIMYYPFEKISTAVGATINPSLSSGLLNDPILKNNGSDSFDHYDVPKIILNSPKQSIDCDCTVRENKVVVTPPEGVSLLKLQNQTFEMFLDGVYDKYGNQASPTYWTVHYDINSLKWNIDNDNIETTRGEAYSVKYKIINRGATKYSFTIDNIPSYITVSPSSGTVAANSSKEVTVSISEDANIGISEEELFVVGEDGMRDAIKLNVNIKEKAPEWNVNVKDYEFSMNIVGNIIINGVTSRNVNDKVAVFVGNQCRGVGEMTYNKELDSYLVFMTVYSNMTDDMKEPIHLLLWNASEGRIMDDISPMDMIFEINAVKGSAKNPIPLEATDIYQNRYEFAAGWNWMSVNLLEGNTSDIQEIFKDATLNVNNQIKGQASLLQYNEEHRWEGNISFLDADKMYMVKLNNPATVTIKGKPVSIDKSIALKNGWNWIGYYPSYNLPINNALENYVANTSDVIKTQDQFAIYEEGLGWIGTLKTMRPNRGYKLKCLGDDARLKYPRRSYSHNALHKSAMISKDSEMSLGFGMPWTWSFNKHDYSSNMNVIAVVDGQKMIQKGVHLGAFVQDKCVGVAEGVRVGLLSDTYYFMTIMGDITPEIVEFRMIDGITGENYVAKEKVTFSNNQVLGNISEPVTLHMKIDNKDKNIQDNSLREDALRCYPNPLRSVSNIEYTVYESGSIMLRVVDMQGRVVSTLLERNNDSGKYHLEWDGKDANGESLPSGVYILQYLEGGSTKDMETIHIIR